MFLFLAFASLVAAVVPMFTYLVIIGSTDMSVNPLVRITEFFLGADGRVFLGILGSIIFQIPLNEVINAVADGNPSELVNLSGAVITAPLVEESN